MSKDTSKALKEQKDRFEMLNDLGIQSFKDRNYSDSLEHFWKSLVLARGIGDPQQKSTAFNNLAMAYEGVGKYDHALKLYDQSLDLAVEAGFLEGQCMTLSNKARLFTSWKRWDKASECYRDALNIVLESRLPTHASCAL